MKIITWNCNGIRARFPLIEILLKKENPDLLFLQETKIEDKIFPQKIFHELGYKHLLFRGEKSYNGVACISKLPFERFGHKNWVQKKDCRHLFVKINNTEIHNFYIPAGGDIPDIDKNEKFFHKMTFLSEMKDWLKKKSKNRSEILLGDLNIAPLPDDVWSHKQLLNVVSHTSKEVDSLQNVFNSGNYSDIVREFFPVPEKIFSWWSYRSRNWDISDRGRRLDHIWVTKNLAKNTKNVKIIKETRGWERPSDHVPIVIKLDLK